MIQSPIRKALSTIRKHRVDHLLMGGQACVLYGAAEFSRDRDLVLLPDPDNFDRLRQALDDLEAEVIAIRRFEKASGQWIGDTFPLTGGTSRDSASRS